MIDRGLPKCSRYFAGFRFDATQQALTIVPLSDGELSISAIALPTHTGFTQACNLSSDAPYFSPDELVVHEDRLICLHPSTFANFYASGFVMRLEPGMAELIRKSLNRLRLVALNAKDALTQITNSLGEVPYPHLRDALVETLALIGLDDWEPEHALDHCLDRYEQTDHRKAFRSAAKQAIAPDYSATFTS
ncbi:MAG: hypothetical protein ACREO8_11535 [Luteimonas sp.]